MTERFPRVAELNAVFKERFPFFRDSVARGHAEFGDQWAARFEESLLRMFSGAGSLHMAAEGYAEFALDALRLQKVFDRTGTYANRSFAEVAAAIYHDEDYMERLYLPGILLSSFLWPHHYKQFLFFEEAFVAPIEATDLRGFYDVGVGTGFYSRRLVQVSGMRGTGFDISRHSQAFAQRQVDAYGGEGRYGVELRDILADPPPPSRCLISVEVLEHLEDPLAYLGALRRMLAGDGARGFITAAVNAPNADHIYLYRHADEVAAHLIGAGFTVERQLSILAYPPMKACVPVPEIAAFVVT
jgi:SAM-dependent methyltransferase